MISLNNKNQKLTIISLFFTAAIFLSTSCEFKNEEELYGNVCDTLNMNYGKVKNIFNNNCSSCHNSGATSKEPIRLDTYNNVKNSINTGLVIKAITHSADITPMPYGGNKLSDCDINKIKAWINNGMPE